MNRDISKTVFSEVIQTKDEQGELVDVNQKSIKILVESENFCLVYTSFWNIIMETGLNKADTELAAYLIQNYGDGTPFTITAYIKEELAKKSGKAVSTYNNCTRVLIEKSLIYKVGTQTYKLNPKFVFKGSSSNRNKLVIEMMNY